MVSYTDVAVIGSGISGASFASYARKKGQKVTIIEQQNRIGGLIESHKVDGLTIEMGAHTCYNSYRNLIDLINEIEFSSRVVKLKRLPIKMFDGNMDDPLHNITRDLNYLEALSIPIKVLRKRDRAGLTLQEYFSWLVGSKNYKNIFRYAFQALTFQNPDNLASEYILKSRKKDKRMPRKFTFAAGMDELINWIISASKAELLKNAHVYSIRENTTDEEKATGNNDSENYRYKISYTDGTLYCNNIAVATSIEDATQLLSGLDADLAKDMAKSLEYVDVESIALHTKAENIGRKPFAFYLVKNGLADSVISTDTDDSSDMRAAVLHFSDSSKTESEMIQFCKEALDVHTEDFETHKRVFTMPKFKIDHGQTLQNLQDRIESKQGLYLVGNYFKGTSIEDCVYRSKTEAGRI